jgi:ATP-binding cassette subfamily B (MDR/TAP) protein 8
MIFRGVFFRKTWIPLSLSLGISLSLCSIRDRKVDVVACDDRKLDVVSLDDRKLDHKLDVGQEITYYQVLKKVWKYIRSEYLLFGTIIVISCGTAVVNVFIPTVMGQFATLIQNMAGNSRLDLIAIRQIGKRLLGLFSLQGVLTWLDIYFVAKLGESLALRLKRDLFKSILNQDMAFFDSRMNGEVVSRLTMDISEFKHTFKIVITQGLKSTTQIIGTCASLMYLSPSLTFTLLSTMPVLYLGMNTYGRYLRKISKKSKEQESIANGIANESVANIKTVKSFSAQDVQLQKYLQASEKNAELNRFLGFHIGAFQGFTNSSIGLMMLMMLYFGGQQVVDGKMTSGQLMAYMYLPVFNA